MTISNVFFALIFSLFVAHFHAYTFYVGDSEGWILHPSKCYSDWASRNRFHVNHTLVFKYTKGEDSVLEMSEQDFDRCNLNNPIAKMDTGYSAFNLSRPGSFFFVSGTGDRCKQGEKLSIVVTLASPSTQPSPIESTLIGSDPVESDLVETDPIETDPDDSDPDDSNPDDSDPDESTPDDSTPDQPSGSGTPIIAYPTDTDGAPNNPTGAASVSILLGIAILLYGLFN